jgi:hypothetical protein
MQSVTQKKLRSLDLDVFTSHLATRSSQNSSSHEALHLNDKDVEWMANSEPVLQLQFSSMLAERTDILLTLAIDVVLQKTDLKSP